MKRPAVNELIQDPASPFQALRAAIKSEMHCALPGIVQAFDPESQTATIQPVIRSRIAKESGIEHVQLPLLANVPVYFPGGGVFALTMPVQTGDECLVVFADSCIDAWWQSGGVQNQIDMRSHDISDGFAFVGFRSRSKSISEFNGTAPTIGGKTLVDIAIDTRDLLYPIGCLYSTVNPANPNGFLGGIWIQRGSIIGVEDTNYVFKRIALPTIDVVDGALMVNTPEYSGDSRLDACIYSVNDDGILTITTPDDLTEFTFHVNEQGILEVQF